MAIRSLAAVLLVGGLVLGAWLAARPARSNAAVEHALPPSLDQLCAGELRIFDLGYALNAATAYWPGPQYEPFRLKWLVVQRRVRGVGIDTLTSIMAPAAISRCTMRSTGTLATDWKTWPNSIACRCVAST
jgi:hypothetical protein